MARFVKNTITGIVSAHEDDQADAILAHERLRHTNVEVDSDKNEVLSRPYWIDNNDKRHVLEDDELVPETFESDEPDEVPPTIDNGESDVAGTDEPTVVTPIVEGEAE